MVTSLHDAPQWPLLLGIHTWSWSVWLIAYSRGDGRSLSKLGYSHSLYLCCLLWGNRVTTLWQCHLGKKWGLQWMVHGELKLTKNNVSEFEADLLAPVMPHERHWAWNISLNRFWILDLRGNIWVFFQGAKFWRICYAAISN